MNLSAVIALVDERVRIVQVLFEGGKLPPTGYGFSYKTLDQTIMPGDHVVVPPSGGRHMGSIGRVVAVDCDIDVDSDIQYVWLVQKLDRTEYERIIDHERRVVEVVSKASRKKYRAELVKILIDASVQEEVQAIIGKVP